MDESVDRENKGEVLSPPLLLISGMDSKKRHTFSYFKMSLKKMTQGSKTDSWKKYHSQQIQKNFDHVIFDKDVMVTVDEEKGNLYLYDLFTMETLFKTDISSIESNIFMFVYPPPRTLQVTLSGDRTFVETVVPEKMEKVIIIHGTHDKEFLSVFDVKKKEIYTREMDLINVKSDCAIFGDYLYYISGDRVGRNPQLFRINLWNPEIPKEEISPWEEGYTPESIFILPSGELGVQIHEEQENFEVGFLKQTSSKDNSFIYETVYHINEENVVISGKEGDLIEFWREGIIINGEVVKFPADINDLHTLYDGRVIFVDIENYKMYIRRNGQIIKEYPIAPTSVYPFEDITVITREEQVWILDNRNNRNEVPGQIEDLKELEKTDVRYAVYMKDNLRWKSYARCVLEIHTNLPDVISSDLLDVIGKYL